MANLLTYTLSLQDKMTSSLKAIGINSDGALTRFAALEKKVSGAKKTMSEMGVSIGSLKEKVAALRAQKEWIPASNMRAIKAYQREIDSLERKIGKLDGTAKKSKSGGGFNWKNIAGGALVAGGLAMAGAGILSGGRQMLDAGMSAGKNKASFEVLSGKEAGGKLFDDLTKFAQDSIFGNELLDNSKMMLAFGIDTKDIMSSIKMLGDISMGDKDKLQSLSLAYSQVMSTGRLMGQDLLQLINAGFNPLKIISEKTGIGMGELKKKMEDGAISAKMVDEAFKAATGEGGQFYKMTEKIAETPFGKWEAFKGQLQGVAMQMGIALMPAFSKVIDVLSKVADTLPPVITAFTPLFDVLTGFPVGEVVNNILGIVSPLLKHLIPAFQLVVKHAGSLWEGLSPVFIALQPIVGMLGQAIFELLPPILSVAGVVIKALSPALTAVLKILQGPLGLALRLVTSLISILGKVIEGILKPFVWLGEALDWVADKFNSFFGITSEASSAATAAGQNSALNLQTGFNNNYNYSNASNAINADLTNANVPYSFATVGANHAKALQAGFNNNFNYSNASNAVNTDLTNANVPYSFYNAGLGGALAYTDGFMANYNSTAISQALVKPSLDSSISQSYYSAGQSSGASFLSGFSAVDIVGKITNQLSAIGTNMTMKGPWKFSMGGKYTGGNKFDNTGIDTAKLPGFDWSKAFLPGQGKEKGSGKKKGGGSKAGQKANDAIATGGTKNTTIHITIGKQIETLTVQTMGGIKESGEQIRDIILDHMTRAIAMSQSLAS